MVRACQGDVALDVRHPGTDRGSGLIFSINRFANANHCLLRPLRSASFAGASEYNLLGSELRHRMLACLGPGRYLRREMPTVDTDRSRVGYSTAMLLETPQDSYRLLAALLARPTPTMVRLMRSDAELPGNGSWSSEYAGDDLLLEALSEEHTRLFVNGFPQLSASPFAATYLDPDRPEQAISRIAERLHAMSLAPTGESLSQRLDHVQSLLAFAAELDPSDRRAFVEEFLASWLPRYKDKLEEAANLPLYPGLLGAAEDLIAATVSGADQ